MEETFDEKKRRSLVERFGVNKGNRLADESEGKGKGEKKSKFLRRRKKEYE